MRIAINATSARIGGGVTVLRNLLRALVDGDQGRHEYLVFGRPDVWPRLDPGDPRVTLCASRLSAHGLLGRALWEELELPLRVWRREVDVVLSPANIAVPACPVPQVLMFQNMVPYDPQVLARYPLRERLRFLVLRDLGVATARRAGRVIFISEHARRSIGARIRIPGADRHHRIYLGRDESFTPAARDRAPAVLARLGVRGRYLLSVSHLYRYKNFIELIAAFAQAVPHLPEEVDLLIAGADPEPTYAADVRAAIAGHGLGRRVRLLGHVSYEDLPPLYAAADMFLFPSTCESCPQILIEAMSSGAPTVASRLPPMPEIAGDGATYFDPFDPTDIAAAIRRVWDDGALRADLRRRGIDRGRDYSWARTGEQMLGVLEQAGGFSPGSGNGARAAR